VEKNVSRAELKEKMDRGEDFVLVDALGREHFKRSHLPGAINLPYEDVEGVSGAIPDRDAEIVIYCMNSDCAVSREMVRELGERGYTNVRRYPEGKQGWIEAGLPTERQHSSRTRRGAV
jgi:rhodanese-related sulfurtransferase